MARFPMIIAHSGCMNTVPNSMESVIRGIKAGADIVEADVRATGDGVVVLAHDECIHIEEYGIVRMGDLTFNDLRKRYAGIVRLEDIFEVIKSSNKVVNLDLKDDTVVLPMAKAVREADMGDYVILSGCDYQKAMYLRQNYEGLFVLLNANDGMLSAWPGMNYESFIRAICKDVAVAGCCGINIDYKACRKELLDYTAPRSIPVCVYTVDEGHAMKKYIDMGVHSITTNDVDLLIHLKAGAEPV